jgi:polysaccharide pyruvyl transferase WcaK-like protein
MTKGALFKSSSLKKQPVYNLNICGTIFSKNKCIISIGKDLGKLIDDNSNKMLLLFIPNFKYKKN